MRLYELVIACRTFPPDKSEMQFRKATQPAFDINDQQHGAALLDWLRRWGCRQFSRQHDHHTLAALSRWAAGNVKLLPKPCESIEDLSEAEIEQASVAYEALGRMVASIKHGPERKRVPTTFGPTGSAKVLFALRPNALPPWDRLIRERFKCDGSAKSYGRFLAKITHEARALIADAEALGVDRTCIGLEAGWPSFSLARMIDQYNWLTVTRGFCLPAPEQLQHWAAWLRPVEASPEETR
jgi:hypothetical protein